MKTVYIFTPYSMGEFRPEDAALIRHTWRVLIVPGLEGSATERMGMLCRELADEVAAIRATDRLPVALVGDCTFSIGMAAGLQRETTDFTLVWYDAHGDFHTLQSSSSGFIGGMPLAMLAGRGEQTILQGAGAAVVPEANIILTDARDLDPGEKEAVAASGIMHLPDVADLLTVDLPDRPIYIHFDCDVLRLADMPAAAYPAQGGPSLETVEATLARLAETGRVMAISLSLWDTDHAQTGQAEQTVLGLLDRFVERL